MITFKQFLSEAEKKKRSEKERKLGKILSQWNKDMRFFKKNLVKHEYPMSDSDYKKYYKIWHEHISPNFIFVVGGSMVRLKNLKSGETCYYTEMRPLGGEHSYDIVTKKQQQRAVKRQ